MWGVEAEGGNRPGAVVGRPSGPTLVSLRVPRPPGSASPGTPGIPAPPLCVREEESGGTEAGAVHGREGGAQ